MSVIQFQLQKQFLLRLHKYEEKKILNEYCFSKP